MGTKSKNNSTSSRWGTQKWCGAVIETSRKFTLVNVPADFTFTCYIQNF